MKTETKTALDIFLQLYAMRNELKQWHDARFSVANDVGSDTPAFYYLNDKIEELEKMVRYFENKTFVEVE